jgi:hypothetical protein
MSAITFPTGSGQVPSLERLLIGYLTSAPPGRIPGCDGMTTSQMLREYPDLAAKGVVPGCGQLQRLHPHYRPQLERFFRSSMGPKFLTGISA